MNNSRYQILQPGRSTFQEQAAENIKVGDVIKIVQGQRVPADGVLLYSTERTGSVFIKTD